jgi:hypothetical protein
MKRSHWVGGALALAALGFAEGAPKHEVPPATQGGTVIELCDGETSLEVPDLKPGQKLSRPRGQAVSDALMAEWRRKNPHARWDEAPPAGGQPQQTGVPAPREPTQDGTYSNFTRRDATLWDQETAKFVKEGDAIFHDANALGGTVGISCDMCHPNAANTHPETYPKYQVQLQRVALLRDMINWCIENPVKGHALADDDPKLRALEAYILAQRKGVPLDYGRH